MKLNKSLSKINILKVLNLTIAVCLGAKTLFTRVNKYLQAVGQPRIYMPGVGRRS